MEAFKDIWTDQMWLVVFVVTLAIGLAGATGLLDRAEDTLER